MPLTDSQAYDLVAEKDNRLYRVQVKTTRFKRTQTSNYQVNFRTNGGNKTGSTSKKLDRELVDYVFVMTQDNVCYFIPILQVYEKLSINLCEKYSSFIIE